MITNVIVAAESINRRVIEIINEAIVAIGTVECLNATYEIAVLIDKLFTKPSIIC